MPGDLGHHGIHALVGVHVVQQILETTAVTAADTTQQQVIVLIRQVIQPRLGPVHDLDKVLTRVLRVHHPHVATTLTMASLIDADHGVAGLNQRLDGGQRIVARLGGTTAAETVPLKNQRMLLPAVKETGLKDLENDGCTVHAGRHFNPITAATAEVFLLPAGGCGHGGIGLGQWTLGLRIPGALVGRSAFLTVRRCSGTGVTRCLGTAVARATPTAHTGSKTHAQENQADHAELLHHGSRILLYLLCYRKKMYWLHFNL